MIKIISITIFTSIALFGRLNPFDADPAMYEVTKKLEPIKVQNVSSKDDGNRTVKVMSENTTKIKPIIKEKIVIKEKIIKIKPSKEEIAKQCKVVNEKKPVKIIPPKPIVKKFVPAIYKVLPFLSVDVNYKKLTLTSRPKYNIVTYHSLKEKNKLAFDFLAKVSFFPRTKKLNSPSFSQYTLGNHKNDGFFRVAIQLKHNVKDYEITIKNNKAIIKYKK